MVKIIEELKGETIVDIRGMYQYSKIVIFCLLNGEKVAMYNTDESCGNDIQVQLEEVVGDPQDLLKSKIILAEQVSSDSEHTGVETEDWVFIKLGTIQGGVTLRWRGRSNGHYSIEIDVEKFLSEKKIDKLEKDLEEIFY